MSDTTTVVIDATVPSFLKRIPAKKIALTATAVVATVVIGKLLKDRLNVDVDVVESTVA